jgi:hypothetical protein
MFCCRQCSQHWASTWEMALRQLSRKEFERELEERSKHRASAWEMAMRQGKL